jgi:predicted phage gp36 major capsid-like protein
MLGARPDERAVLERAIQRVTEQAAKANAIVDEAMHAGLDSSEPFVVNIKRLRAELLSVKIDLRTRAREGVSRLRGLRRAGALRRRSRRPGRSLGTREPAPHETPKLAR